MSLPQFVTALRKVFGESMLTSEKSIEKLFASFDLTRQNQMDWRSFLVLITMMMQPDLSAMEHIRYLTIYCSLCLQFFNQ